MKAQIFVIMLSLCTWSMRSLAEAPVPFHFFIQGLYSTQVTLNKVQQLFGDLDFRLKQEIAFHSGPSFEGIDKAIDKHELDLLLWGYSDELNEFMTSRDFKLLMWAPIDVHAFRYHDSPTVENQPLKIGVLTHSTALFSATHYYDKKNINVEFIEFNNYFDLMQACFRKELNLIVAAKTFLIPQPEAVQQRFKLVETLPSYAKAAIWVKANTNNSKKTLIQAYFKGKQELMTQVFGTGEFSSLAY